MCNSAITISPKIEIDAYVKSVLESVCKIETGNYENIDYLSASPAELGRTEYFDLQAEYDSADNGYLEVFAVPHYYGDRKCVYRRTAVKKYGYYEECKARYIVCLHGDVLSFDFIIDDRLREPLLVPANTSARYEFSQVRDFIISKDNGTIIVYFEDGSFRVFGKILYNSKKSYTDAECRCYGRCLEDGFRKVTTRGYSSSWRDTDIRDDFSGLFGIDSKGHPILIAHQNLSVDPDWYVNINEVLKIESLSDIVEFDCIQFTTLNKDRTEIYVRGNKKLRISEKTVKQFSNSKYYGVFVDNTGVISGEEFAFGCTDFEKIEGEVKKAFAFALGTVVLTEDGKLHNCCNRFEAQAYESLAVPEGVLDIARNRNLFLILCENGELYGCERQPAEFFGTDFAVKPYGEWKLIYDGIDHISCFGEEILAYPKNV